jgi:hypothetical protein
MRRRLSGFPLRRGGVLTNVPSLLGRTAQPAGVETPSQRLVLPVFIYPPAQSEPIDEAGYVLLPAIAAEATVVTFLVPRGRNGVIKKIANNFVGGGWVEGTGDVIWRIEINGVSYQGYQAIVNSLGNPSSPTELPGFIHIVEGQTVSIIVANVAVIVAGQLSGGRFMGYHYPREMEDPEIWL